MAKAIEAATYYSRLLWRYWHPTVWAGNPEVLIGTLIRLAVAQVSALGEPLGIDAGLVRNLRTQTLVTAGAVGKVNWLWELQGTGFALRHYVENAVSRTVTLALTCPTYWLETGLLKHISTAVREGAAFGTHLAHYYGTLHPTWKYGSLSENLSPLVVWDRAAVAAVGFLYGWHALTIAYILWPLVAPNAPTADTIWILTLLWNTLQTLLDTPNRLAALRPPLPNFYIQEKYRELLDFVGWQHEYLVPWVDKVLTLQDATDWVAETVEVLDKRYKTLQSLSDNLLIGSRLQTRSLNDLARIAKTHTTALGEYAIAELAPVAKTHAEALKGYVLADPATTTKRPATILDLPAPVKDGVRPPAPVGRPRPAWFEAFQKTINPAQAAQRMLWVQLGTGSPQSEKLPLKPTGADLRGHTTFRRDRIGPLLREGVGSRLNRLGVAQTRPTTVAGFVNTATVEVLD